VTGKQKTTALNLRLPVDLHRRLKTVAAKSDRSLSKQIIHLLREAVGGGCEVQAQQVFKNSCDFCGARAGEPCRPGCR
jgi:hypothetical protein